MEVSEAHLRDLIETTISERFQKYAEGTEGYYFFSEAVRKWLRNELPSLLDLGSSCAYGLEVHNAGRVIIDSYVRNNERNRLLVELIQGVVRDMQESDARESEIAREDVPMMAIPTEIPQPEDGWMPSATEAMMRGAETRSWRVYSASEDELVLRRR